MASAAAKSLFVIIRSKRISTLFPYTTLFRSSHRPPSRHPGLLLIRFLDVEVCEVGGALHRFGLRRVPPALTHGRVAARVRSIHDDEPSVLLLDPVSTYGHARTCSYATASSRLKHRNTG